MKVDGFACVVTGIFKRKHKDSDGKVILCKDWLDACAEYMVGLW